MLFCGNCPPFTRALICISACIGGAWLADAARAAETISVKILVDEEEATIDRVWMQRLTDRVHQASAIIAPHAGVRFVVREYGRWSSDNRIQDFSRSLTEFERRVSPGKCKLAIGFSSQYQFGRGLHNLGGTRGPLRPHILIRENAPTTQEPERLEVLVHELGHYLGAAHSASTTSVMRPIVADGQARYAAFKIEFDRNNQEIIRLVGREIQQRSIGNYFALSPTTLASLKPHYRALQQELPDDTSADRYLAVIDGLLSAHGRTQPVLKPIRSN